MNYYQLYYQIKRDKIRKRKKERYWYDEEHREKVKKAARDYQRSRAKDSRADRMMIISTAGVRYLTIGRIARMIRRSIYMVREYHRLGVIPTPTQFNARGWRLYTREQANLLQHTFRRWDRREFECLAQVGAVLHKKWREYDREEDDEESRAAGSNG